MKKTWLLNSFVVRAILMVALFSSCSSNYYCKKCQKLGGIKTDSTSQVIELKTPEVKADTTIQNPLAVHINFDSLRNANPDEFAALHDTVRIDKDRLHIKLVTGKTIYVQGKCDSVIKEKIVTKTVINTIETGINKTRHYIDIVTFLLLGLVAGAGIMRLFR